MKLEGCPEDTFKVMKTEFVNQMDFHSLRHLELELCDDVNLYNKHQIHGTLDYMSSINCKK
ncbi:IS3 family transposase [Paenibacillus polymyxa]|uniref:IS3 family transposase n=1 Tax=Paenibacillus polymyxa TaxID=1406 RepID=UPI0039778D47